MDSYLNINDSNMRREINVTDIYDKEDNNYNNYDNMNTTDTKSIDPNCVDVIGVDVDSGDNLDVSCSRGLTVNGCGSDDRGGCSDGWHRSGSNSSIHIIIIIIIIIFFIINVSNIDFSTHI